MTFAEANNYLNDKKHLLGQSLNGVDTIQMLFVAPTEQGSNLFGEYLKHSLSRQNIRAFIILNRIIDFDVYVSYSNIRKQKVLLYESLKSIINES